VTSVEDPDPGSGAFLTPGSGIRIRDRKKNPDPGSGLNTQDNFSDSLEAVFWVTNT